MANLFGIDPRIRVHMVSKPEAGSDVEGDCKIFFNEFQVYGFSFSPTNFGYALRKLGRALDVLRNFPVKLTSRADAEALLERRVWYREQPAICEMFDGISGTVRLRSAFTDGFEPEPWDESGTRQYRLDVDLLSEHVHWSRE